MPERFRRVESNWRHRPADYVSGRRKKPRTDNSLPIRERNESFALSCRQSPYPETFPQLPGNSQSFTAEKSLSQYLNASQNVSAFMAWPFFDHIFRG
jgi:hypothetical protein